MPALGAQTPARFMGTSKSWCCSLRQGARHPSHRHTSAPFNALCKTSLPHKGLDLGPARRQVTQFLRHAPCHSGRNQELGFNFRPSACPCLLHLLDGRPDTGSMTKCRTGPKMQTGSTEGVVPDSGCVSAPLLARQSLRQIVKVAMAAAGDLPEQVILAAIEETMSHHVARSRHLSQWQNLLSFRAS